MAAVVVVVGVFVVGLSVFGLVSNSFSRVGSAVSAMGRTAPLQTYPGRPNAPSQANAPENFAVFVADGDTLAGAFILHLSASRNDLTVLALPSDMPDADRAGRPTTLAEEFNDGPSAATHVLEDVTGARMDHQILLHEEHCWPLVAAVGGVKVGGSATPWTQTQVHRWVDQSATPAQRAARLAQTLVAVLSKFSILMSVTDPGQFDQAMDALPSCMSVDPSLTSDDVSTTLSGLKVKANTISAIAVPSANGGAVTLAQLRMALADDDIAALAKQHPIG